MKLHTTNYFNTLIEISEDTKTAASSIPKSRGGNKTIAELQFEMVSKHPYKYTSDDVFFAVFALREDLHSEEMEKARSEFFSKGQPCFRSSPLPKQYGFGVHSNEEGRVALIPMESEQYNQLLHNPVVKKIKAMRSSRKTI